MKTYLRLFLAVAVIVAAVSFGLPKGSGLNFKYRLVGLPAGEAGRPDPAV